MSGEVAIDARWLRSGIGTYIRGLVEGLGPHKEGLVVRAIVRKKDAAQLSPFCDRTTVVDVPIYTLREQWAVPRAARGAGLLHVPHYNAPLLYSGKLLVTLHDLIHITEPAFARGPAGRFYASPMLHWVSRKACHIVTVSRYSQAQIVERLGVNPSKVTVIHHGVGENFQKIDRREASRRVCEELRIRPPYVLYVGNLKPHKNIETLIRSFAIVQARRVCDRQLVLVGDDEKWQARLVQECRRAGIEQRVRFVPEVSEELLPSVYGAADLFVLPSWIEGFGLTLLEAMACGTPVVCSRAASLPEVAGDGALYFDPSSAEDLADALQRVLESPGLQESLRQKGFERARRFSWDDCARRHAELYREILRA